MSASFEVSYYSHLFCLASSRENSMIKSLKETQVLGGKNEQFRTEELAFTHL